MNKSVLVDGPSSPLNHRRTRAEAPGPEVVKNYDYWLLTAIVANEPLGRNLSNSPFNAG